MKIIVTALFLFLLLVPVAVFARQTDSTIHKISQKTGQWIKKADRKAGEVAGKVASYASSQMDYYRKGRLAHPWDHLFESQEKQYLAGDFADALQKNRALYNQTPKTPVFLSWFYLHEAKYEAARGNFIRFDSLLRKGTGLVEKVKSDHLIHYMAGVCKVVDAYLECGQFYAADKYLEKAARHVRDTSFSGDVLETHQYNYLNAEFDLRRAQLAYHRGDFNRSAEIISTLLPFYQSRVIKKTKVEFRGKTRMIKLSRQEVARRRQDYAMLRTLLGRVYTARGEYHRADSVLVTNEEWIHEIMGRKNFAYAYNTYSKSRNFQEDEKYIDAINTYYDILRTTGKKTFSKNSRLAFAVHKGYMESLIAVEGMTEMNSRFRSLFKEPPFQEAASLYTIEMKLVGISGWLEDGYAAEAEAKMREMLPLCQHLPGDHPQRARLLEVYAAVQTAQGMTREGIETQQQALKIRQAVFGESSLYSHLTSAKLAAYLISYTNRFAEANTLLEKSHATLHTQLMPAHTFVLDFEEQGADLLMASERYGEAVKKLENLLSRVLTEYENFDLRAGYCHEKLAMAKVKAGDYRGAADQLELSVLAFSQPPSRMTVNYINALKTVVYLYTATGMYQYATETLRRLTQLFNKAQKNNRDLSTSILDERAWLYIKKGKYQETEELLWKSVTQKEKKFGVDYAGLVTPMLLLGELYLIQGNYPEAEKQAQKASAICRKVMGDSSLQYAASLSMLSRIYEALGDHEKAEFHVRQAMEIQKNRLDSTHIEIAHSMTELALIKLNQNVTDRTVEKLLIAAKDMIFNAMGEIDVQSAEAVKNLALLYLKTGRIDEAFALLDQANTIWVVKLGKANIHSAAVSLLKGDIYLHRKEFKRAENQYESARDLYREVFDEKHPEYVRAVSKLGQMYFIKGDYKNALKNLEESTTIYLSFINTYFPALSEREKNKFWNLIKSDFEFYNSLAIKMLQKQPALAGDMYNFVLTTKALLLNTSIKVKQRILSSGDTALINRYRAWVSKKEEMATFLSMSRAELEKAGTYPADLEKEVELLEKELSGQSTLFAQNIDNAPVSWTQVRDKLKTGEVAIEIIRFRQYETGFTDSVRYAALIVTPSSSKAPELVLMSNGNELENTHLRYYRNCMRLGYTDSLSYKRYWQPIEKALKGASRVYLAPDGVYNQVNLTSMCTGEGMYVIDKTQVVLVSNTRDLIHSRKPQQVSNIAYLIGNPQFYNTDITILPADKNRGAAQTVMQRVAALPGAESEVRTLDKLLQQQGWQTIMMVRDSASEESIRNINSPRIFHIATHGFFLRSLPDTDLPGSNQLVSSPLMRSGLLLKGAGHLLQQGNLNSEDGILTAYEAMNLNFDNTELVVLSACETGLGDIQVGEGVFGLQRAFQVAGAQSIIMSMFYVSDEITNLLMATFYQKWLATNNRRQAFTDAQKEVRTKYPHPQYWGTFNMVGL